jgi:hypothetical protein
MSKTLDHVVEAIVREDIVFGDYAVIQIPREIGLFFASGF